MSIQTATLKKQHIEIKKIMEEITTLLDSDALKKDAEGIRSLISRLVGKLNIHLAMEDNVLYPSLANSSDSELKEMGHSFQENMGGLRQSLKAYLGTWPTPEAVQENSEQFVRDTQGFFDALKTRIQLEDDELFTAIGS